MSISETLLKNEIDTCAYCGTKLSLTSNNQYYCAGCGNQYSLENKDDNTIAEVRMAFSMILELRFDEAEKLFDNYIRDHQDAYEAYWGKFLSQNRILYVDDGGKKMIPTFADMPLRSLQSNPIFQKACEYAPDEKKSYYQKQIKIIEDNIKEWQLVKKEEKPYDIFISYKDKNDDGSRTNDSHAAYDLYNTLKEKGFRVFFSRVSMTFHQGKKYEPYIYNALNTAKIMIVCGSKEEYFNAKWVRNEWTRYLSKIASGEKKEASLIPVLFDRLDPYALPMELRKLQALDASELKFMENLLNVVNNIVRKKSTESKKHLNFFNDNKVNYDPSVENIDDKIKEWNGIILKNGNFNKVKDEINTYIAYAQSDIPPQVVFLLLRSMSKNYSRLSFGQLDGVLNATGELKRLEELKAQMNRRYRDLISLTGKSGDEINNECRGEIFAFSDYKSSLDSAITRAEERAKAEEERKTMRAKHGRSASGFDADDIVSGATNIFRVVITIVIGLLGYLVGIFIPVFIAGGVTGTISALPLILSLIVNVRIMIKEIKRVWDEEELNAKKSFLSCFFIGLLGGAVTCVIELLLMR